MQFGLISYSFENTPIEVREKINFTSKHYQKIYKKDIPGISELIVVSTCNRTELYYTAEREQKKEIFSVLIDVLNTLFDINKEKLDKYKNIKTGFQVIRHLLKVASGLKSQVIGEQQILGQIKDAQQKANNYNSAGKSLNYIFRKAITIAKQVRTETKFSDKNLSLSSVAVSFIEDKYENLLDKDVLVVGVGKMSRIVLEILQDKGIKNIYATNRTHGKVIKISKFFENVIPVNYSNLHETVSKVDIVISSTSAPHYLIYKDKLLKHLNNRDKDIVLVDLGVPRDIDPEIGEWPEMEIYNLDQLHEQMEKNKNFRFQEMDKAEDIIKKGLKEVEEWLQCQKIVPVIKTIKKNNSEVINKELQRVFDELELEKYEKNEIEKFARHLSKNLFNEIILNLRELAVRENCNQDEIALIKDIFDI